MPLTWKYFFVNKMKTIFLNMLNNQDYNLCPGYYVGKVLIDGSIHPR